MPTSAATARSGSLSDLQRRYLEFVADGLTSKQIAHRIGGSHHTINAEIGIAMRILGATSRRDAAALFNEVDEPASYERSYEPTDIVDIPSDSEGMPHDEVSSEHEQWQVPVPTKTRPTNRLSAGARLGWVLVIAASVALLLGGLVSGVTTMLTSLGRLG